MTVRCPHGIECDYVYRKREIRGEEFVVGGDYWHDEDTRCKYGEVDDPDS